MYVWILRLDRVGQIELGRRRLGPVRLVHRLRSAAKEMQRVGRNEHMEAPGVYLLNRDCLVSC